MFNAAIPIPTYSSLEEAQSALMQRYADWMQTTVRDCNAKAPMPPAAALRLISAWHTPLLDSQDRETLKNVIDRQFGETAAPAAPATPTENALLAVGPAWEMHRHLPGETTATTFIEETGALLLNNSTTGLWNRTTGLFRLSAQDPAVQNTYAHLPILQLALRSYAASQNEALLHIADRYAERWADALLNSDALPLAINHKGPILELAGAPPVSAERARVRLLIEKGATDAFQHLYALTASPIYLIALRKLLDIAASDLRNAGSAYAVAAIQRYANDFDDGYFDEYVRIAAARVDISTELPLDHSDAADEDTDTSTIALKIGGEPAPPPALLGFFGRLTRRPRSQQQAHELAVAGLNLLVQRNASPLIVADLLRSSLCQHGAGWAKDLIDTRCPYTIAVK